MFVRFVRLPHRLIKFYGAIVFCLHLNGSNTQNHTEAKQKLTFNTVFPARINANAFLLSLYSDFRTNIKRENGESKEWATHTHNSTTINWKQTNGYHFFRLPDNNNHYLSAILLNIRTIISWGARRVKINQIKNKKTQKLLHFFRSISLSLSDFLCIIVTSLILSAMNFGR